MSESRESFVIAGAHGLHARPAGAFVKAAAEFSSDIKVRKGEREANAKSMISVLSLGANQGDQIEIAADGPDAAEAVARLGAMVTAPDGE